jgi:hypothetical protein
VIGLISVDSISEVLRAPVAAGAAS